MVSRLTAIKANQRDTHLASNEADKRSKNVVNRRRDLCCLDELEAKAYATALIDRSLPLGNRWRFGELCLAATNYGTAKVTHATYTSFIAITCHACNWRARWQAAARLWLTKQETRWLRTAKWLYAIQLTVGTKCNLCAFQSTCLHNKWEIKRGWIMNASKRRARDASKREFIQKTKKILHKNSVEIKLTKRVVSQPFMDMPL